MSRILLYDGQYNAIRLTGCVRISFRISFIGAVYQSAGKNTFAFLVTKFLCGREGRVHLERKLD